MKSRDSHMSKQTKTVYWICDKVDCQKDNYRLIPADTILFNDRCDGCFSFIHEPILIEINNERKRDKQSKQDD